MHGISRKSLEGMEFDLPALSRVVDRAERIIAHNAEFDARMLRHIFPEILHKKWLCSYRGWPWPSLDNRKLDTVCKHFGIHRDTTHNAYKDCEALASALFQNCGKTERSRTYMRVLLEKRPLDFDASQWKLERATSPAYSPLPPAFLSQDNEPHNDSSGMKLFGIIIGVIIGLAALIMTLAK